MATIDDFGDTAEPLNNPVLGGPAGWAAAVRDAIMGKVSKAGDTMTGALTLPGNPTVPLHAATKGYVDGKARRSTGTTGLTVVTGAFREDDALPEATRVTRTVAFGVTFASTPMFIASGAGNQGLIVYWGAVRGDSADVTVECSPIQRDLYGAFLCQFDWVAIGVVA